MFLKAKKIINSKVVTQSGQFLGRVTDFELDIADQRVSKYFISGFLKERLIISSGQVIEIKEKEIIVDDAVIRVSEKITTRVEYAG